MWLAANLGKVAFVKILAEADADLELAPSEGEFAGWTALMAGAVHDDERKVAKVVKVCHIVAVAMKPGARW